MTATLPTMPRARAPIVERLANGATVIAEQIPVEAVNLNVWFGVGSASEPDAINGMAHFLEHMVFKGTDRLAPGEFDRRIEARGAALNAATSQDYTHYYITAAPRDFTELAPLQLDVACNPSIPAAEFERERQVVLEEIRRAEDNPMRRTYARAMTTCFERLPYRRPVLGPAEAIAALVPEQMRAFHREHYVPSALTAVVVGNLAPREAIATVAAALEPLPARPAPARTGDPEAPFAEIVRCEYDDDQLQQTRLVLMWRVPGLQQLADTYALDVLAAVLGQGKSSRLFRDLREDRQLVTGISASNSSQRFQGTFYISAHLDAARVETVESAIAAHIRRLQTEPVLDSELARIRTQVANRHVFASEKPSDRANLYGYYYAQLGDLAPALEYAERIRAVSAADVQEAARRYLAADAYGIVIARARG